MINYTDKKRNIHPVKYEAKLRLAPFHARISQGKQGRHHNRGNTTAISISVVALIAVFAFLYFFTGAFGGTFLGVTLKSNPDLQNGLVAHYTFDGEYEQGTFEFGSGGATTTDPTDGSDSVGGITADLGGYIYVAGITANSGCPDAGSDTCFYTYKIDPINGDMVWATTTDVSSGTDWATGITSDSNGFIYVTGYTQNGGCTDGGVDFCHYTFKVDPANGDMIWATSTDPSDGYDAPYGITSDSSGYIYVTGNAYNNTCGGGGSDECFYTYKIDASNGDMVWATTTDPSSGNDRSNDITADEEGYLYLTGYIDNNAHYTFKVDPSNGDMLWATTTDPSTGTDQGYSITSDPSGYIYVAGRTTVDVCGGGGFDSCFYTYKIDPLNGDMLWATTTDPSDANDEARGIAVDRSGYVYVTGFSDNNACGGSGSDQCFYTYKLDPSNGDMLWATSTDSSDGSDAAESITVNNDGYVFVSGRGVNNTCGGSGTDSCHYTFKLDPSDGSFVDTTSAGAIASVGAKKVPGNIGQGVEFDGVDDYITTSSFTMNSSFSVSAWINYDDATSDRTILNFGNSNCEIYLENSPTGSLAFWNNGSVGSSPFGIVPSNEWSHVTITYDGSDMIAYVEGAVSSSTLPTTLVAQCTNAGSLVIGSDFGNAVFFDGGIDDLRVYDRTLSASEVSRLYDLGATTKISKTLKTNPELENGLYGHWTFDGPNMDLSSNTAEVLDKSGNGNNGNWLDHSSSTIPGRLGSAIALDDVAVAVEIPEFPESEGVTAFTVSAWTRFHKNGSNERIISKDRSGFTQWYLIRQGGGDPDKLAFRVGTSTGEAGVLSTNSFGEDFEWHHVVGVYDDPNLFLYIDNELVGFDNDAGGAIRSDYNHDICIGAWSDGAGNCTDSFALADVDDVRYYNRALSTSTINRLYQLGATTKVAKTIDSNDDLKNGLVGHWTFDGPDIDLGSSTAEAQDRSGNGNDGDWQNHASTTYFGRIGQAIEFDGVDDLVFVPDSDSLSFSAGESFSVAAWVKTDSCPVSDGKILEKKEISYETYALECQNSSGKAFFSVRDSDIVNVTTVSNTVIQGDWHHLVGVKNGNIISIYIDGAFESSNSGSFTGNWNDGDLYIGNSVDGGARDFDGILDDVRIYNKALTADEVLRLYQLGM